MGLEWKVAPKHETVHRQVRGAGVTVTVEYCPQGYVKVACAFSNPALHRSVDVQVLFDLGNGRRAHATRKVTFHSTGEVVGYGDARDGVRFFCKDYQIEPAIAVIVSAT